MNPAAPTDLATPGEVAEAARIVAAAGLVEAFGHVSARAENGFLITSTRPMGAAAADDIHLIDREGRAGDGAEDVPLETPLHAAIYESRPDVGAICRTHSPAAVAAGAAGSIPPLAHGLAGLAGEVKLSDRVDLVTNIEAAREVAGALGSASCVLIRGNGSVAVGRNLAEAVVRARYLEERCLAGEGLKPGDALDAETLAIRSEWFEKEVVRAWAWMQWRYVGDS